MVVPLKPKRGAMTNIHTLLEGHVTLKCECIDRIFLNGYVPQLQTGE